MREGWTNCADCKFLEPDSLYCQQMLRSVNLGCPYGQEKVVMTGAERDADCGAVMEEQICLK